MSPPRHAPSGSTGGHATTTIRLATNGALHRSGQKHVPTTRLRVRSRHSETPVVVSRTMSCDLVETRMRIRPRESSLPHPFTASSSSTPIAGFAKTAPRLDRAPFTDPAWVAPTLLDERNQVIDQRCVRPTTANDTSTTGTHVSFGDSMRDHPCGRLAFECVARFTTPHTLRMSRSAFVTNLLSKMNRDCCDDGRFLPVATPTEGHPLTLPSPRSTCPPSLRRVENPLLRARRPCERAAETTFPQRPVTVVCVPMIRSAFHRTGEPSRDEVSLTAFRFGAQSRSPGGRVVHEDVAVRSTSATTIRS